jgi:hypothetical protein
MSLVDYALVTPEDAARYILRDDEALVDNPGLEADLIELINGYSDLFRRFLGREFVKPDPDTAIERAFVVEGASTSLEPSELREITGNVVLISGDTSTTLTSKDYSLRPVGKTREGTWLSIRLKVVPGDPWAELHITGKWGMAEVPPLVRLACLKAIKRDYRNPEGFSSRSLGEFSFSEVQADEIDAALPKAIRDLLAPFRRAHYVGS